LIIESIFVFTSDLTQLRVWVKINDHTACLFIDSDCTRNYMFSEFARKAQIFMQKKKESYNLRNFNEIFMKYINELINQEIQLIHLRLKCHWEKLRLNVTKQSDSNIVLDISWLCTINSMIDWVNETIIFLHIETTRLHSILKSSESVKIFAMTVNNMRSELKNSSDAQMLWSREIKIDWSSSWVSISIFWLNSSTWYQSSDSTWILDFNILTWSDINLESILNLNFRLNSSRNQIWRQES